MGKRRSLFYENGLFFEPRFKPMVLGPFYTSFFFSVVFFFFLTIVQTWKTRVRAKLYFKPDITFKTKICIKIFKKNSFSFSFKILSVEWNALCQSSFLLSEELLELQLCYCPVSSAKLILLPLHYQTSSLLYCASFIGMENKSHGDRSGEYEE